MFKKGLTAVLIVLFIVSEIITLLLIGNYPFEEKYRSIRFYNVNTQTTNRWPLFPVCDDGKWGYINSDGEYIIVPRFAMAYEFDEKKRAAKICFGEATDNRSIRDQIRGNPFRGGYLKYGWVDEYGKSDDDVDVKEEKDSRVGVLKKTIYNEKGEVVFNLKDDLYIVGAFKNDVAIYEDRSDRAHRKEGIINIKGEMVTPCLYDFIDGFSDEGIARVTLNGQFGYINTAGEVIVPIQYSDAQKYFQGGFGWVQATKGGAYSLINTRGEVVFSGYYENVEPFSEGLAAVKLNGKYGFTDSQGNLVVPVRYDWVKPYKEGMAIVAVENRVGYVNKQGVEVVPPQYTEVKAFNMGLAAVQKNGRYSFITVTGAQAFEGDFAKTGSFVEDMVWVQQSENGPYGYIDRQGQLIYPCQFEAVEDFHNGLARVNCEAELSGSPIKFYEGTVHLKYIDKKGNSVWPKK